MANLTGMRAWNLWLLWIMASIVGSVRDAAYTVHDILLRGRQALKIDGHAIVVRIV